MKQHDIHWLIHHQQLYLNGLEGAAEQHVVGGDKCTNGVVMGTDCIDFLQGLDVPHLHKTHGGETKKHSYITHRNFSTQLKCASFPFKKRVSREVNITHNDGAVCRATV